MKKPKAAFMNYSMDYLILSSCAYQLHQARENDEDL